MPGMVDPLAERLAAIEASLHPSVPAGGLTQPIDGRLTALKVAAAFVAVNQIQDPVGTDLDAMSGTAAPQSEGFPVIF